MAAHRRAYIEDERGKSLWREIRSNGLIATASRRYALFLFIIVFVAPTTWAFIYFGLVSADRYVSETKFLVRGVNSNQVGGLSALLNTFGISRANDDSYAIHDYIVSRDALAALEKSLNVRSMYQRNEADFMTAYSPWSESFDGFYRYYSKQISLKERSDTGITTLRVSAYRPDDAKSIADQLLKLSEQRVNEMNMRARVDALRSAMQTLSDAEQRVLETQIALTKFRNDAGFVNPENNVNGNFEVIAKLSEELSRREVDLRLMKENSIRNPNIADLVAKTDSLRQQIALEQQKLTGPDTAIANKLGAYEELVLKRALADKAFESATNAVDQARQEANRKQIYLEPVTRPNLPDRAEEPKRLRYIFTTALLSFSAFVMIYLLVSGSREHLNLH